MTPPEPDAFNWPKAEVRTRTVWRGLWLLPVLALVFALVLVYQSTTRQGIPLIITFQHGYGLKIGDTLRYRGIDVGLVQQVTLTPDLEQIQVTVQLKREAAALARTGSHFWIVHPQLDLSGITGLDTVLGAKYIAVLPGQGEAQRQFVGLDNAPLLEDMPAGGLEIVLQSLHKGSLQVGARINFRGLPVGRIISVELASDASAVDARVYIQPEYVRLLSPATQFWQEDGFEFEGGFTSGFSLHLKSLQSILSGQIQFATPQHSPTPLASGHRFVLYPKPQPEWLTWKPAIPISPQQHRQSQPKPVPAILRWQQQEWLMTRQKQRLGWLIPVKGGLLATATFLQLPAEAEQVQFQWGDQVLAPQEWQTLTPELRFVTYAHSYPAWELPTSPYSVTVDTQVIAEPTAAPKFISAARYSQQGATWLIDGSIGFTADWQGAAVVDMAGQLVGLLQVNPESPAHLNVLPVPLLDSAKK